MAHAETSLLQQLNINSDPYRDPLSQLNWAALNTAGYWLPPSAISLHGIPEFEALPELARQRLSHYELIGFIQAGIWLEGMFLERLGKTLKKTESLAEYAYQLHEIREEAGHSLMFLRLIEKSGLHLPVRWLYRPHFADFMGRHSPANSTLFWLAVVIGEEVPDRLNRHVRHHADEPINPLIRQMCTLHIIDEARHIAHARNALDLSLQNSGRLGKVLLTPLINLLIEQFVRTFYLPKAEVYELAGLTPGKRWRDLARANPTRQAFISQCINPTLNLLQRHGFKVKSPIL